MAITLPINVTVTAQGLETFKRISASMDALQNKVRSRIQRGTGAVAPRITQAAKTVGFNTPRLQDVTNRLNLMSQAPDMISPSELKTISHQLNLINREMVMTATKGSGLTKLFTNWQNRVSSLLPEQQELYKLLNNSSTAMSNYAGQMKNSNVLSQLAHNYTRSLADALNSYQRSADQAAKSQQRLADKQQRDQRYNDRMALQKERLSSANKRAADRMLIDQQRLSLVSERQRMMAERAAAAHLGQSRATGVLGQVSHQLSRALGLVSRASVQMTRNISRGTGAVNGMRRQMRGTTGVVKDIDKSFGAVKKGADRTQAGFAGVRSTAQGLMIAMSALQGNLQGVLFSFIFFGNGIPALILGVAALTAAIVGLSSAVYKAGRSTEDMLNKFRRIRGSAEEAAKTFGIAQTWAIRYGYSIDEVADAMQGLEDHGMLTQRALKATMNLAAARGMTVAEASNTIASAIGEESENLDSLEKVGIRVNKSLIDVTSRRAVYEAALSAIEEKYGKEAEIRARTTEGALKRIGEAVSASMRTMLSPIWMDMFLPLLNRIANLAAGMYEFIKAMWMSQEAISFWNDTISLAKSITVDYREELDSLVRFVKMVVAGAFWAVLIIVRALVIGFKLLMESARALGKVFQWLGRMLKPLADMFRMLWQIILGIDFGLIGQKIKDFLGSLPTIFPKTTAAIDRFRESFSTFWDTFAGPVWEKVKGKAGELWNYFKVEVPGILESARSIIDTVLGGMIDRISSVLDFLVENKETVLKVVDGILQGVGGIIKFAIDGIAVGLRIIDKFLQGDFDGAREEMRKGGETLGKDLRESIEGFGMAWEGVTELIQKGFNEWLSSDYLEAQIFRKGIAAAQNLLDGIEEGIKTKLSRTQESIKKWFEARPLAVFFFMTATLMFNWLKDIVVALSKVMVNNVIPYMIAHPWTIPLGIAFTIIGIDSIIGAITAALGAVRIIRYTIGRAIVRLLFTAESFVTTTLIAALTAFLIGAVTALVLAVTVDYVIMNFGTDAQKKSWDDFLNNKLYPWIEENPFRLPLVIFLTGIVVKTVANFASTVLPEVIKTLVMLAPDVFGTVAKGVGEVLVHCGAKLALTIKDVVIGVAAPAVSGFMSNLWASIGAFFSALKATALIKIAGISGTAGGAAATAMGAFAVFMSMPFIITILSPTIDWTWFTDPTQKIIEKLKEFFTLDDGGAFIFTIPIALVFKFFHEKKSEEDQNKDTWWNNLMNAGGIESAYNFVKGLFDKKDLSGSIKNELDPDKADGELKPQTWGNSLMSKYERGVQEGWSLHSLLPTLETISQTIINLLTTSLTSYTWGYDLMSNMEQGALSKIDDIKETFKSIGKDIHDAIMDGIGSITINATVNAHVPEAVPMAMGGSGIVNKPTLFLAGEAGVPERYSFEPLRGGRNGDGGGNVVIEINISGNTLVGNDGTKELARIVSEEIAHKLNRRTAIGFVR